MCMQDGSWLLSTQGTEIREGRLAFDIITALTVTGTHFALTGGNRVSDPRAGSVKVPGACREVSQCCWSPLLHPSAKVPALPAPEQGAILISTAS